MKPNTIVEEAAKNLIKNFLKDKGLKALDAITAELRKMSHLDEPTKELLLVTLEKLEPAFRKVFSLEQPHDNEVAFDVVFIEAGETTPWMYIKSATQFLLAQLDNQMHAFAKSNEIFMTLNGGDANPENVKRLDMQASLTANIANNLAMVITKSGEALEHHCRKEGYKTFMEYEPLVPKNYFFMDVETMGFQGRPYAFSFILANPMGEILDEMVCWYEPTKPEDGDTINYDWAEANVLKHLREGEHHIWDLQVNTEEEMIQQFNEVRNKHRLDEHCFVVADCPFPCETNFLNIAGFQSYPIIDIASMLLMCGKDPLGSYERLPEEARIHHPYDDVRQTYRMFFDIVNGKAMHLKYRYNDELEQTEVLESGSGEVIGDCTQ